MASTTGRQGNVDSVGTKGPQVAHVPDTAPYTDHTSFDNFEAFAAGKGRMRGYKTVDPRNVRGGANYK